MEKLVKSVTIDAPIESVFAYISEPYNHPKFWPHLKEVRQVEELANGGASYCWPYTSKRAVREGYSQDVVFIPNERIVTRSEAAIDSTVAWTFEPLGDETLLTVEIEYVVAIPMPSPAIEGFINSVNARDFQVLLTNLQASAMAMRQEQPQAISA